MLLDELKDLISGLPCWQLLPLLHYLIILRRVRPICVRVDVRLRWKGDQRCLLIQMTTLCIGLQLFMTLLLLLSA